MWHWVKARVRTNQDIDPHLFTREIAVMEAIKMVNTEDEAQENMDDETPRPVRCNRQIEEKNSISAIW